MSLEYRKFITRNMLQEEREKLFVFGDNLIRKGYGGQARAMRGEPNAVGIVTKLLPTMDESAFFSDTDADLTLWRKENFKAEEQLFDHISEGGIVVWPELGIGTGLAQLEKRSPEIFKCVKKLENILGLYNE